MTTAIVNEANSPTAGSTSAMTENEIASGISASATTRPARTSVRHAWGSRSQSGPARSCPAAAPGRGGRGGMVEDNAAGPVVLRARPACGRRRCGAAR
ncbi:hypothetical protein ACU686_24710 [Yinghuangia aomiensis]